MPPPILLADTLILRNGKTLEGRVISQNRGVIRFRYAEKVLKINKSDILRLHYDTLNVTERKAKEKEEQKRIAEERKQRQLEQIQKQKDEARRAAVEHRKQEIDKQSRNKETNKSSNAASTAWSVTWRSAVMPGWGQWELSRQTKSFLYGGLFLAGSAGLFRVNQLWKSARSNLADPSLYLIASPTALRDPALFYLYSQEFLSRQEAVDLQYRNLRYAGISLFAIYIWNIIDVRLFHSDREDSSSPGVTKAGTHQNQGWRLDLYGERQNQNGKYANSGTGIHLYYRRPIF